MLFIRIMRNYFDDDEEEFFEEESIILEERMEERKREDFIKNCNEAYQSIEDDPETIIGEEGSPTEIKSLINALNRMCALFIIQEEYEKCSFLKKFMENKIPEGKFEPRIEEVKKFLGR